MDWMLWLDDQCLDPDCPARHTPIGFVGAGSTQEAIRVVRDFGPPSFIDFDHDLGRDDTAKDFLKWLYSNYPNNPPQDWAVHSANPMAKDWIDSFINSWHRSLRGEPIIG